MTSKMVSSGKEKTHPLLALTVRDFRLYWLALITQVIGQQMFAFTLGWLAFEITGSQAQLGFIHPCGFVPQFTLTLLGGVLAGFMSYSWVQARIS